MSTYVFDTNIVSLLLRRDTDVTQKMQATITASDTILGCPVVWYEIRRGLLVKDARTQMKHFEQLFNIFIWQDYNHQDWELAAKLWAKRRSAGQPIADADLLIGVFTFNRNAILVTDNEKDFTDLSLTILNWKQ
jgi:tRNA(fMet)-specific endonuclease VapC